MEFKELTELNLLDLNDQKIIWCGALSFEERCYGSLKVMEENNVQINKAVILNYKSNIAPNYIGEKKRRINRQALYSISKNISKNTVEYDIRAHVFQDIKNTLNTLLEHNIETIVFDISCLTKIHTIALAVELCKLRSQFNLVIAYTIPESYGIPSNRKRKPGWKDILIAPLAETAQLLNEAYSRSIVILGHENERLIIAFTEIEPSGGIIIAVETIKKPEMRLLTERKNKMMTNYLTKMYSNDWKKTVIGLLEQNDLIALVKEEINKAKKHEAPVFFFPFGPKSSVFFTSQILYSIYPEASWFVYPIPSHYDASHSEGIAKVTWLASNKQETD